MPWEPQPSVLFVDDDVELGSMVLEWLSAEGLQARHAASLRDGFLEHARQPATVLVLDLMLPDGSGLDVCRRLKQGGDDTPVLVLSARGEPMDRVVGLEAGADDYLAKPFEPRELVARVRALARRQRALERRTTLRFGPLQIDVLTRRASYDGRDLGLTTAEFKLLSTLAAQPGVPLTRDALVAAVQPRGYMPVERAVDVQVARLRKKLRSAVPDRTLVDTVRGEGYVFTGRAGP